MDQFIIIYGQDQIKNTLKGIKLLDEIYKTLSNNGIVRRYIFLDNELQYKIEKECYWVHFACHNPNVILYNSLKEGYILSKLYNLQTKRSYTSAVIIVVDEINYNNTGYIDEQSRYLFMNCRFVNAYIILITRDMRSIHPNWKCNADKIIMN